MALPGQDLDAQWFHRQQQWWVYPKSLEAEVQASLERGDSGYDNQPEWNFAKRGLEQGDAREILREFSRISHEASQLFDWTTNYPSHEPRRHDGWKIDLHGWKHVSFQDLVDKARKVREMEGKSLYRRTVFNVRSFGGFESLVEGARNQEPAAVAQLWHLCQHGKYLSAALEYWFEFRKTPGEIKSLMAQIPNPIELGNHYLESIFSKPGKGSTEASKLLKTLSSPGRIQGGGSQGGHPTLPHNWADVVFVRGMVLSLLKQLRKARAFLTKSIHQHRVAQTSCDCLGIDDTDFVEHLRFVGLSSSPVVNDRLANFLAAKLLSTPSLPVSPSYVKKALSSRQPA